MIHTLGYGGYGLGYGLGYRGYGYGGHLWKRDADAEPSIGYYGGKCVPLTKWYLRYSIDTYIVQVMEATDLVMDLATEATGMAATCGRGMPRLSPALATMVVMCPINITAFEILH